VPSVGFALTLLAAALGYGAVRLSGEHFTPGPRVALAQGSFPSRLYPTHSQGELWYMHNRLTAMGVQYQPDFVIWPESAFPWPFFDTAKGLSDDRLDTMAKRFDPRGGFDAAGWRDAERQVRENLGDLATQANAGLIVGLSSFTADAKHGVRRYNTAAFARPELGLTGRYDKRHLVPFGEFVPLRDVFPFLRAFSPYTDGSSCEFGEAPKTFRHGKYVASPLICYEDTVPHLVRADIARAESNEGERIDLLVNVTNDGWFDHSSEQEQHLVTSLFRAVETRTPLVRAANTGISAVIDGDGRIVQPVAFLDGDTREPIAMTGPTGRFTKDRHAVLVADVPLDPRRSLYVRFGDWFAGLGAAAMLFCLAWSMLPRRATAVA
jgi:apolipoprotein N-acyltransferase